MNLTVAGPHADFGISVVTMSTREFHDTVRPFRHRPAPAHANNIVVNNLVRDRRLADESHYGGIPVKGIHACSRSKYTIPDALIVLAKNQFAESRGTAGEKDEGAT